MARGWVWQARESNRRRRLEDISVPLVVEGVRGVVGRDTLDKRDDLAMSAMGNGGKANTVCVGEGRSLDEVNRNSASAKAVHSPHVW